MNGNSSVLPLGIRSYFSQSCITDHFEKVFKFRIKMKFFIISILVVYNFQIVLCHERFWGECPSFTAQDNFNWEKVTVVQGFFKGLTNKRLGKSKCCLF